jgi:hypothetical protein
VGKKFGFVSGGAPAMIGKNNGVAEKCKNKQNERTYGNRFFAQSLLYFTP